MTFPVIAVFHLETQGVVLRSVGDPLPGDHPLRARSALASNHEEHRTPGFVKCVVREVPLQENTFMLFAGKAKGKGAGEVV